MLDANITEELKREGYLRGGDLQGADHAQGGRLLRSPTASRFMRLGQPADQAVVSGGEETVMESGRWLRRSPPAAPPRPHWLNGPQRRKGAAFRWKRSNLVITRRARASRLGLAREEGSFTMYIADGWTDYEVLDTGGGGALGRWDPAPPDPR